MQAEIEKIEEVIKARNAYFNKLEENPLKYLKDYTVEKIQPNEMKVGDLMYQEGCIYKITEIKVFDKDHPRSDYDLPVYVTVGTYVGGSISIYKLFSQQVLNGCAHA